MIRWRAEGEIIRNGLNVWRPSDKGSAGFVLRLGNYQLYVRWSKIMKQWIIWWGNWKE